MIKFIKSFSQIVARRFLDASLRAKMILVFLMITLIPIGILAYLNYQTTRSALTKSGNQALFAAASETAVRIDNFMSTTLEIVENIAHSPDLRMYPGFPPDQKGGSDLENRIFESLFTLKGKDFYISSCAVLDNNGKNILDTLPANIGKDESDQLYFQNAFNTRRVYVSPVEFPRQRGSLAFYFSSPIHYRESMEINGVLRIRYNVAIFQHIISKSSGLAGEQSYAILLNEHHLILAHSMAPELLFKLIMPLEPGYIAELQETGRLPNLPPYDLVLPVPMFAQGLKHAASQPFFVAQTHPNMDQLEQIAVVKLKNLPWLVVFVQPQKEFLAPVNAQAYATLGLAVIIVIIVIAVAVSGAQLLTTPITRLTVAAEQIATGNLTTTVSMETDDEIGKLGRTFTSMTTRLQQTLEDLNQHRIHLEELVKERTLELEQEVVERKYAEEAAKAANQAKSEFLSRMSHELRTPLNAILGYTQLLKLDKDVMDRKQEAIEIIHRSGEYLLILINDLLDLSRIEARQIELRPTNVHLSGFLKNIVEMTRIQTTRKALTFTSDIPSDLSTVVHADEHRLRQILLNLLNNAIKFTEQGSVTLRVKVKGQRSKVNGQRQEKESLYPLPFTLNLLFEVEDTGVGIPPEHLPHIFDAFYQGNRDAAEEGSGLGLTISQQLVRLMGSELYVKSTVGQGSVFWFDLSFPVVTADMPDRSIPDRPLVGYVGARRKILLVDDNAENRTFLRDLLLPLGFELQEAANGRDALKLVQIWKPHLILMDLFMSEMDGFETTKVIRKLDTGNWLLDTGTQEPGTRNQEPVSSFQFPVIIAVSASVSESVRQESLAAGCDDFLGKPMEILSLLECLQRHLGLEWIYATSEESDTTPPETMPLVIPPSEVLCQLIHLANNGYINDLEDLLAELAQSDVQYRPFAAKMTSLVENFQLQQIIAELEWYLQEQGVSLSRENE